MRYVPDHKGIAEMLNGPEMHKLVGTFADAGRNYAVAISPVDSGEYAKSFEVERGLTSGRIGRRANSRRAMARLHNKADHAAAVEWFHGHHVLSRTVDYIERYQF